MKSISPIIATILLIVIVVTISGILYAFLTGMFGNLLSPVSSNIQSISDTSLLEISNAYWYDYRNGLVLEYRFDAINENSSIVYDLSGNGNNGIIYNINECNFTEGPVGEAITFSGNNGNYVLTEPFTVYGWQGITIIRWMIVPSTKPNTDWSKSFMIGDYWADNVSFFQAYPNSSNIMWVATLFTTNSSTGKTDYYLHIPIFDNWVYIANTFNLSTRYLTQYIDGSLQYEYFIPPNQTTILQVNPANAIYPWMYERFTIGCNIGGNECVNETVNEVRIYNVSLSPNIIQDLYYRIHVLVYNPSNYPINLNNTYFSIGNCVFSLIYNYTFITSTGSPIILPEQQIWVKITNILCHVDPGNIYPICFIYQGKNNCYTLQIP